MTSVEARALGELFACDPQGKMLTLEHSNLRATT